MARTTDLPVHFRTGLRAVGIVNGRPVWPILGGDDSDDAAAQAAAAAAAAGKSSESDPGFPANTALEQMTVEQRESYWKDKARKHEDRVKSFGKLTPEELTELRAKADKHDALEFELGSEADKKAAQARKDAEQAADAKYQPMLAETAFRIAIGDRRTQDEVDEFIGDLNLPRFLTDDGRVDTAKVLARVDQFAPATGTAPPRKPGPSSNGMGYRGNSTPGAGSVAAGRDLYAETHPKK